MCGKPRKGVLHFSNKKFLELFWGSKNLHSGASPCCNPPSSGWGILLFAQSLFCCNLLNFLHKRMIFSVLCLCFMSSTHANSYLHPSFCQCCHRPFFSPKRVLGHFRPKTPSFILHLAQQRMMYHSSKPSKFIEKQVLCVSSALPKKQLQSKSIL